MNDLVVRPARRKTALRRGHWRTRWHTDRPCEFTNGSAPAGEWIGVLRWPSAEVAEQKALDYLAAYREFAEAHGMRFLGPVFFPEGKS